MLDTQIVAVPAESRKVAEWLRTAVDPLTNSADRTQQVRGDSEQEWIGEAADLAREHLVDLRHRADEVADMTNGYARTLSGYADAMEQAIGHMAEARAIAQGAGLAIIESVITDPPTSADPGKGGPGHRLVEDRPGYAADVADRQAKIEAYKKAEQKVLTAREIQQRAEEELQKFVDTNLEKSWVTGFSAIASYTGGHLKLNKEWRALASKSAGIADTAEELLNDPYLNPHARSRLLGIVAQYRTAATTPAMGSRDASTMAAALERLPASMRAPLMAELPIGAEGFRAGLPGLALTTVSAGMDIAAGKDAGKIVGTNAGSTVAGAVAGGAIATFGGGPVAVAVGGTIVGNVVATGLGYVYDGIKSGDNPAYTTENGQYRTPPMSR